MRSGAWIHVEGVWCMPAEWATNLDGTTDVMLEEAITAACAASILREGQSWKTMAKSTRSLLRDSAYRHALPYRCIQCHLVT